MKFFYYDAALDAGILSSEAVDIELADALSEWSGLSDSKGSFIGFYTPSGNALQMIYEDDEHVIVDIPVPDRGGSLVKACNVDECRTLIVDLFAGCDPADLPGLTLMPWAEH